MGGRRSFRGIILTSATSFFHRFMRVFGLIFVLASLAAAGPAQDTKPGKPASKPKPSAAAAKKPDDKKTGTTKKADAKNTVTAPAKRTPSNESTASRTTGAKINNPAAPNPVARHAAGKPDAEAPATADDAADAAYEKIASIEDATARVAALRKFVKTYSKSKRAEEAYASLVSLQTQFGNDKLVAGDMAGAVQMFRRAIADAPAPVPDQLFADTLAKFPANLYFRGGRAESFEVAKALERKSAASVPQLLSVATFFLNIENGSEARRVVEAALKVDPESSAAYQTLGLAYRMDFQLEESAEAYAKALALDPESTTAKRGLSEMKRALGKADEAVTLYREIVAKDEADLPSRTGLVLAMYDAGLKTEADAELAKALEQAPGNVILLAGASYWLASHGEAERSIDLATRAISADPRFIWSHIALARGYTANRNPIAAEKTLIAARRYGNFPTLEFEIARARVAAGFFREAAEELAKSFSVKDGGVQTKLGGRVARSSKDLNELVGYERRASIFAPGSADGPELSARMVALLELQQELAKSTPDADIVVKAAEEFAAGEDKMKVHRLVYAANQLLEKKIAPKKVVELAKSAPAFLDAGLDAPDPAAAVMASELYESRTLAAARSEFINVPVVPRATLSAILRGRVEEMSGWAQLQLENAAQASVHLKRAVSVLPVDSAWWRSSTWRLGTALVAEGKPAEALEIYIRNYKSSQPDALRYSVIEALYRQVNGSTLGLENRIGPDPSAVASAAPRPRPVPTVPAALAKEAPPSVSETVVERPTAEPSPASAPDPSTTPEERPSPVSSPTPEPSPEPTPVAKPSESPVVPTDVTPEASPTPAAKAEEEVAVKSSPTPVPGKEPSSTAVAKETAGSRLTDNSNGMFPPVVITIPPPPKTVNRKEADAVKPKPTPVAEEVIRLDAEPTPAAGDSKPSSPDSRPRVARSKADAPAVPPCTLTLDQDAITVQSGGNERAVVIRRTDDGDIDGITATATSTDDLSVRREPLPGVKWTALFVLKSLSGKPGLFQVLFEAPCGRKEVPVRVQ
jgi:tetratricopeptide (TPR) repeat protein